MEKSRFHKARGVFVTRMTAEVPFSPERVLENAADPDHVPHVHRDSIKSCELVMEDENLAVLIYHLIPIKWLRFYTKPFLVLKRAPRDRANELDFVSFPISTKMVSWLTVKAGRDAVHDGCLVEHKFRLRLAWHLRPLARLILFFRNRGERRRWDQDYELMTLRDAAVRSGYGEDSACLSKRSLLESWFGSDS